MSERQWSLRGMTFTGKSRGKLSQCPFIHNRSHMDWPGIESGRPRWEAEMILMEIFYECAKWTKLFYSFYLLIFNRDNILFHECRQFLVQITNYELSSIVLDIIHTVHILTISVLLCTGNSLRMAPWCRIIEEFFEPYVRVFVGLYTDFKYCVLRLCTVWVTNSVVK
jgi:hypothetical protein